jgi:hypothetical protein
MKVKSWVLNRAHRMSGVVGRGDLPPRDPAPGASPAPVPRTGNGPPANVTDAVAKASHPGPMPA